MPAGTRMAAIPEAVEITGWLVRWREGDERARDRLFSVVHPYLRQLAWRMLQRERRDHTLEPNAVVNEAYLRLIGHEPVSYQDRAHSLAIAAQTMRRILIDHARARIAEKRGGAPQRVPLSVVDEQAPRWRTVCTWSSAPRSSVSRSVSASM